MKFMTPRNLRRIFPVLTLCALLPASAWGKTHWKDGYIVRANGDTLTGQIAFTEHNRSPGNITFRPLPGAPGKQYHPADLQAFKVKLDYQDIYFRSVKTEIDMSPTDLSAIDNLPKPVMEEHEFFAQLLTGGKRELYAYQEPKEHKRHYLVPGPDGKLTDLIHKRYFQDASHAQPVYFDGFKEQLI
jgi:hypothetical protein